jgi:hypothetical protein
LHAALTAAPTQPSRKPLTPERIKAAVLGDPTFGASLMSMMRDDAQVSQVRLAIEGIARAVEAAHGIGGEHD